MLVFMIETVLLIGLCMIVYSVNGFGISYILIGSSIFFIILWRLNKMVTNHDKKIKQLQRRLRQNDTKDRKGDSLK